jgi:hypothetical protein
VLHFGSGGVLVAHVGILPLVGGQVNTE